MLDNVRNTKETLKEDFGVEGLSKYEEEELEKIVAQCIIDERPYIDDVIKKQFMLTQVFEIEQEAIARWLLKLYGIRP